MIQTLITANGQNPPKLLTKKEVGRELVVSERTVHDLIMKGLLPVVRFGGNVRIDRADLEAFIQRQKEGRDRG